MKQRRWIVFGLAFLLVLPASMPAFGWDKIIAFGDSLSDNGPEDGYGLCIASNGPVWLDYLAASMRDVELEDRALCGAQTDGPVVEINGNQINIGMTQQVSDYINSLPADADLSGILFTVWIGGNDLLDMAGQDPVVVIATAIYRIANSIQDLVDAGAEDILVMTLPDLGLAPIYNQDPYFSAIATGLSATFNAALTQVLCDLRGAYPDVKLYMADTFKLLQYIVENGELLGFTNVDGTCVEGGAFPSCEGYIFFDEIHPTTFTHRYVAALALGQVKHGRISKEMKAMLKKLNPIQPRKPFVVNCFD